jgi:hypothetical protein
MKRSDLLYVMSLGRGGMAAGACLDNRWYVHHGWSDAARAASLAVRRAKSAARGASEGAAESSASTSASSSPSSSGGEGGEAADDAGMSGHPNVSALNQAPNGKTYVGFTDNSVEPPRNHYLPVGGEEDGWKVVSADYDSEEVVLEKDGKRITVNLGGGPKKEMPEAGDQIEDGGDGIPETMEYDGEGFDLGDAWEDFQESGIWSMGDTHREGILEDIRERYEQEGDSALEHGERKFLELYEKWESVQSMAGMIVEGGGGEPPPFSQTQARLREAVDDPAATDEERNEAQLVYRAEMEAARRIWEAKAGQAYYTKYGRSADTEAQALEGEQLAGVPYEYAGSLADGYMENRRRCKRRRRELANRVETEALARLANVGWTDEARVASLVVRRANAAARSNETSENGPFMRMPESVSGIRANGRYRTEYGKTVFVPDGTSSMPPAGEGEFVVTSDSVSAVLGGKLVRLGSPKVVSVGPHGTLCVTFRGRTYNLGDVRRLTRNGDYSNPNGGLYRIGKVMYARINGGWVSLETGEYLIEPRTRLQVKR